jgi:ankyrin repeat protein
MKILLKCKQLMSYPNAAEKIKGYVNHLDHHLKSALHLAAENEATAIVVELLTNQANFDIRFVIKIKFMNTYSQIVSYETEILVKFCL